VESASDQEVSSTTFTDWEMSLLIKGYFVNKPEESFDVRVNAAAEDDENDDLTVDDQHVKDGQHLVE
jgi:hypothetical protein